MGNSRDHLDEESNRPPERVPKEDVRGQQFVNQITSRFSPHTPRTATSGEIKRHLDALRDSRES